MSYKTNPIANRLNINKGFNNVYFLDNKTAYNHNLIFWLSLYLFIKSYLAFKKIRLLSCEIRKISQTHKILYISILKNPKIKKKRKRKNIYSSRINQVQNKNAIYLIYKNLNNLKNLFMNNKNKFVKNFQFYYKKIHKLFNLYRQRNILNTLKTKKINANISYKINYKNKLTTNSFNILFLKKKKLQIQNTINQINELKRLSIFFKTDNNVNNIWFSIWIQKKLKNIIIYKNNIKKDIFFKHQKFLFSNRQHLYLNKKIWKAEIRKQTFYLRQISSQKNRFLETQGLYFLTKSNYHKWKLLTYYKWYLHYFIFYKNQHKKLFGLILVKLKRLFLNKKKGFRVIKHYKNMKKKIFQQYLLMKKLKIPMIKRKTKKFKSLYYWYLYLLRYKKRRYIFNNKYKWVLWKKKKLKTVKTKFGLVKKNNYKVKAKLEKKKKKKFLLGSWKKKLLISLKKKLKRNQKKIWMRKKKKKKKIKNYFFPRLLKIKRKKKKIKKYFLKRLSKIKIANPKKTLNNKKYIKYNIKEEYFKNKIQYITFQLQLKLEKLIAENFHISFIVKLTNFSKLFNNKKIFFNIFKVKKLEKSNTLFVSYNEYSKDINYQKINKFNILNISNLKNKKFIENIEKEKENFFLAQNNKILGKSFYALINHGKYFNAQLLADEISNLLYKRKKQMTIFNSIKTLLESFSENPRISYRITVNGKMNSKSRATNVTVVKGHIPTQNFLERVNFGMSQAKTPTGTFGIRVHIFF